MKSFTTLIMFSLMSTISYANLTQKLNCRSEASQTIKADMTGYTLSNIEVKSQTKNWTYKNVLASSKSYDMFESENFSPLFPYPVYSLGSVEGCSYLLALPGGDMRNHQFTGLLFIGGKCAQKEIELNCSTY